MRYLFIVALCLVACQNRRESGLSAKFQKADLKDIGVETIQEIRILKTSPEVIEIPKDLEKGFKQSEVIDSCWLIKLQTLPEAIIGRVTKLIAYGGKLFVFDYAAKAVLIFDGDGTFIKKIRPIGRGPGEFIYPIDFEIDRERKEILVYENKLAKVLYFDLEGSFLYEKNVGYRFSHFFPLKGGDKIVYTYKNYNAHLPEIQNYQLLEVDSLWKLKKRAMYYSYERQKDFNFLSLTSFQLIGSEVVHWPAFSDTVYTVSDEGLKPRYVIDAGERKLPLGFDYDLQTDEFFGKYGNDRYFYCVGMGTEGTNFVYFSGESNQKKVFTFYSKRTKQLYCSYNIEFDQMLPFVLPRASYGDILISTLDAYVFSKQKDEIMKSKLRYEDKQLLSALKEDDNPVLIFYRVKNF